MKRYQEIDALKGILIISVMLGHLNVCELVNWFHMPLFFIISGYLMPINVDGINSREWIIQRVRRLLVPYFVYWLIVLAVSGTKLNIYQIYNFAFGGRKLVSLWATWWFTTCLLIAQCVFLLMVKFLKQNYIKFAMLCYILAIAFSFYTLKNEKIIFYIPWNLDVCLLAIAYLAIGRVIRTYSENEQTSSLVGKWYVIIGAISIIGLLLWVKESNLYEYAFNMKYSTYRSVFLPIAVPISFGVVLWFIINKLKVANKFLAYIGKNSMVIMYTHQLIFFLVRKIYDGSEMWYKCLLLIIALMIACVWQELCKKNTIMSALFVGTK